MRELCQVHRRRRVADAYDGELQLRFIVRLDDYPMVGVAAGNILLLLLEELRVDEIIVHQVRLELDG